MARTKGSTSMTEEVYQKLYEYIISGDINPGESLNISSLKEKFNVSLAVVREALLRLTAQGIVVQKANCGFTVIGLTPEKLEEVIESRKINEGAAIRLSIKNADITYESQIIAKKYELDHTPVYLDKEKKLINSIWNDKHYEFHYSLIQGCNNATLLHICNYLWNISKIFRKYCLSLSSDDRNFKEEHEELMTAVLNHDEEKAVKLFEDHMDNTKKQLISILNKNASN